MKNAFGRGSWPVVLILASLGAEAPAADPPAPALPSGRKAVDPVAPEVPASIVGALQDGKYDEADRALAAFLADARTSADARSYATLLRGVALRLAKKYDPARELLTAALKAEPKGRWAPKIRSELAAVEVAAGKFAAAEALARAEAEELLEGDRKDRLAEVYRGFADRLLKPDLPTVPADPEGAYALLVQARSLAKGDPLRARLLLAMGRSSQAAGNPTRAIQDYSTYLSEYPKGAGPSPGPFPSGRGPVHGPAIHPGAALLDRPRARPGAGRHGRLAGASRVGHVPGRDDLRRADPAR